jgi:acetyltransferase EpsM
MVIADIIRAAADYEVAGFLDDADAARHGTEFCGATILGGAEQLDILHRMNVNHLIIGIGDNSARLRLSGVVRNKGYSLATAIHPRAVVARGVTIGTGTAVMAGAVINPGVRVGGDVIINTCASIEHECVIEDGVHVSTGVRLGGLIIARRGSTIEIGATVAARLSIGAGSVVGAGSLVLHSVPEGVLAYGTPARVVRSIQKSER